MTKTTFKTLKIAPHGISARFINNMSIFLRDLCFGIAEIDSKTDIADIDIFDNDVIPSKKLLEKHLEDGLLRPTIVLSLHDYTSEGVIHVKKPITAEDMLNALKQANKVAERVSKITVEYGVTAIPKISSTKGDQIDEPLQARDCSNSGDQLQQISDWFDKELSAV